METRVNLRLARRGRVTALEVARLAGVSRSAVSRCFSGSTKIAPATREKVRQAALSLGYRPNAIARSLTGQRTDLVAIIVAEQEQENPYTRVVEDTLMVRLAAQGKRILTVPVTAETTVDESLLRALDYQVDGIIVVGGSVSDSIVTDLMALDVPLFLYGGAMEGQGIESVSCDNLKGGATAARFLLRGGHQRIAYLTKRATTYANTLRRQGFVGELERAGQRLYAEVFNENSYQGGLDAALRLLSRDALPDAIFCFNDIMALGALDAANSLKLRVPDDLSILGFDDIPMASWRAFNLTTFRNEIAAQTSLLVERMAARWAGEQPRSSLHTVEPTLVVRGTTR